MSLLQRYFALVTKGALKPDARQVEAARRLAALASALKPRAHWFSLRKRAAPPGLYLWGDVGRGKSMLMDLFFESAPVKKKQRVHFNAFMAATHARIHEARKHGADDPIPPVAREIADDGTLLCFDEFQVTDVADAMILGRLFEQLFALDVTVVATSNTPPDELYRGGLNRQLFLPFIAELKAHMDVFNLNGPTDYRLARMAGLDVYLTPLDAKADAAMDAAWARLSGGEAGEKVTLTVLGHAVVVPRAANGVARFDFADLCMKPLAAADYLAVAHIFHTVLIGHIPAMTPDMRNEARRFTLLIDTLYDEGVKLICSAAAPPDRLFPEGDGADTFARTASRLVEMRSADYFRRGHAVENVAMADLD